MLKFTAVIRLITVFFLIKFFCVRQPVNRAAAYGKTLQIACDVLRPFVERFFTPKKGGKEAVIP